MSELKSSSIKEDGMEARGMDVSPSPLSEGVEGANEKDLAPLLYAKNYSLIK